LLGFYAYKPGSPAAKPDPALGKFVAQVRSCALLCALVRLFTSPGVSLLSCQARKDAVSALKAGESVPTSAAAALTDGAS
jgi:hypothetical protein